MNPYEVYVRYSNTGRTYAVALYRWVDGPNGTHYKVRHRRRYIVETAHARRLAFLWLDGCARETGALTKATGMALVWADERGWAVA